MNIKFYTILISLLFLSSCGNIEIDYNQEPENFTTNNGFLYYKGEPFTGFLIKKNDLELTSEKTEYNNGVVSNLDKEWYLEGSSFNIKGKVYETEDESRIQSELVKDSMKIMFDNKKVTGKIILKKNNKTTRSYFSNNGYLDGENLVFSDDGEIQTKLFVSDSSVDSMFTYFNNGQLENKTVIIKKPQENGPFETLQESFFENGKLKEKRKQNEKGLISKKISVEFPYFLINKQFTKRSDVSCENYNTENNDIILGFKRSNTQRYSYVRVYGDHWGGPVKEVILSIPENTLSINYEHFSEGSKGDKEIVLKLNKEDKTISLKNYTKEYKLCYPLRTDDLSIVGGDVFKYDFVESDFVKRESQRWLFINSGDRRFY